MNERQANRRAKIKGRLIGTPLSKLDSLPEDDLVGDDFCSFPDQADLELALAKPVDLVEPLGLTLPECEALQSLHAKLALAAAGQGAYPPGCNPEYPGLHAAGYFDPREQFPSHLRRRMTEAEFQSIIDARVWGPSGDHNGRPFTMKELVDTWGNTEMGDVVNVFCEEAARRIGIILYPTDTGSDGQHNIHVSYVSINGAIGVGWFPDGRECPGDHVNLHIEKDYREGFQEQVGLKYHEFCHTLGGPHQFDGQDRHQEPLSYRYRNHLFMGHSNGDSVFGLPRAPSMNLWKRLYHGEPVGVPWKGKFADKPTDPPGPTDPPMDEAKLLELIQRVVVENAELLRGPRGLPGPPGERGRDGVRGVPGLRGLPGPTGEDGMSDAIKRSLGTFSIITGDALQNGNVFSAVRTTASVANAARALNKVLDD